jgi:peptide chain release factor 2
MEVDGFWNDNQAAQAMIAEVKTIKALIGDFPQYEQQAKDLTELLELAEADKDEASAEQVAAEAATLAAEVRSYELKAQLSGKNDHRNAFITFQAGAGGTEACDWAQMLMRMYVRWAERRNFKVQVFDIDNNEEAGIKSAILKIEGPYAYGYLKGELGVHRLVRNSPFNADGKRQTSFAAVDVTPEFEATDQEIVIPENEIERCQQRNAVLAMELLKAKIARKRELELEAESKQSYSDKGEIAFGSQIRSYFLQPYTMINDHRTELKETDAHGVLDGKIDPFIEQYLRWRMAEEQKRAAQKKPAPVAAK